jgi:hypothetical protein
VCTVIAVILHLPLTPAVPFLRALERLSILRDTQKDWDYKPEEVSLPIELIDMPKPEPTSTAPDNAVTLPAPGARPDAAPKGGAPKGEEAKKATARQAAEAKKAEQERKAEEARQAAEARKQQAEQERREKEQGGPAGKFAQGGTDEDQPDSEDAQGGDPGTRGAKAPPVGSSGKKGPRGPDAIGLKGKLDDKVVGKPNVSFALWMPDVRAHPLGGAVGEVFACNPEWKPFLKQGIKPIEDLEGVMMVGPQLSNSARFTIAVQHNLGEEKMASLIEDLVKKGGKGGRWLEEGVGRVILQRRERVIFSHPRDMVFVAPPDAWRDIRSLSEPLSLPASKGRALSLTLRSPAKPLRKLGVQLPERLAEIRLDVFANKDGSVDLQIEMDDDSEASATADAPAINRTLGSFFSDLSQLAQTVTSLAPSDLTGDELGEVRITLPTPDFTPVGKRLTATSRLTSAQSGKLLGLLSRVMCPKKKGAPPAAPH